MKQIIKPKQESYNINLQINWPDSKKSNWCKLRKLDKSLIGTSEYMGFAWFWDHEIKTNSFVMFPSTWVHSQHKSNISNLKRYTATLFISDYEE